MCGAREGTWLEVTVKVAVLVDVGEAAQDLEGPFAHLALRHQLRLLLHQLIQVAVLPQPTARQDSFHIIFPSWCMQFLFIDLRPAHHQLVHIAI